MKQTLYLITFFLLTLSSVMAQQRTEVVNSNNIIIEGRVTDSLKSLSSGQKATVTIRISKFPTNGASFPAINYTQEIDKGQHFKFIIPALVDRLYMQITFSPIGPDYWSFIDNVYILEKGDRINCELSSLYFKFSGKGSAKLQCQSEIYKHKYKGQARKSETDSKYNLKESEGLDSVLKLRLGVVKEFAPRLGQEMTNIMLVNCYGMRYYLWLRTGYITSKSSIGYQSFIQGTPYKNIDFSLNKKMNPNILVASPIYCDFLYEKLLIENLANTNGKKVNSFESLERIFNKIIDEYKGVIRDKLLTIFFLRNKVNFGALSWLDTAMSIIQEKAYKEILFDIKRTKSKWIPFNPFQLEDNKGNIVTLDDFKNKVVLIDFWFTGCGPCKTLNKSMEPVFAYFKNNTNVKFVSISIDANKSEWLKSIASGDYTHADAINLFLGGKGKSMGAGTSLISKYNITYFPTLFLLKNCKIYEFAPPKPLSSDRKDGTNGNTKELINLINEALTANLPEK